MTTTSIVRRTGDRQRAIVTGGAGFIGSHLVDRLLAADHDVLVVDDLSSGVSHRDGSSAELERLDIATDELDRPFRSWRPHVVYHLAAQVSVPASIADPLRDLAVNVAGTNRVVAAARVAGARRIVFVSSGGAIYGNTDRPATETTRADPTSYYGFHKLAAEGHVQLGGVAYAIARPSNVYGPRQRAGLEGAVIAAFVDQAVAGVLRIHGDGLQTRDFVHVHDVVEALCLLGRHGAPTGSWNVASGLSVTILELADLVERTVGRSVARELGPPRPGDVRRSAMSAARLMRLGWRARIDLSAGIAGLTAETT